MSHNTFQEDKSLTIKDLKKSRILQEIRNSSLKGISMKELIVNLGYNRRTIHRLIKEINKSAERNGGEIIYKEYNKGNFVLSSQIAKNTRLKTNIFRLESTREILGGTLSSSLFPGELDLPQEFKEIKQKEDSFVESIHKYRTDLTQESKLLYEFSLKIGSIITFFLCSSIKPPTSDEEREWTNMMKVGDYDGIKEWNKKRDEDIDSWLNNSIDLQVVFNEFIRQKSIVKGIMMRKIQVLRSIKKLR